MMKDVFIIFKSVCVVSVNSIYLTVHCTTKKYFILYAVVIDYNVKI